MALRAQIPLVAVIDTLAVLVVYALLLAPRLSFRIRAVVFSLICYMVGTGLLVAVGPVSQVYLLAYSLLSTMLLGTRAGSISVLINGITLFALGASGLAVENMASAPKEEAITAWSVVTSNFVFVNVLLVLSLGAMLKAIESALVLEQSARGVAEHERSALLRTNVSLRSEIDERKRAEQALAESDERFRELAENVRDVFYNYDPINDKVLYVSPSYETIWGRPLSGVYASYLDYFEGVHPEDRAMVMEATERQLAGEATATEGRVVHPDGTVRWVRDHAYPVLDESGAVRRLVGTVQDITERKEAEAVREALEEQLREAHKLEAVGRLAGGIAHDFNNMLTIILGHASLAREALEPSDPLLESIESIAHAGKRCAELTQQLLAYARRQTISPRVLDLDEIAGRTTAMLHGLLPSTVAIRWIPGTGEKRVKMDPSQVEQVLTNLILNARDAVGERGTITVESRLAFGPADALSQVAGPQVVLSVRDDGCGMNAVTASKIFDPFFTTKPIGQASGLGLSTVYGIVKQNGGAIEVKSEPGEGAEFRLYLPLCTEPAVPAAAESKIARPPMPGGDETILLAIDNTAMRTFVGQMLARLGYTVLSAANAAEAQRIAESHASGIRLLIFDEAKPPADNHDLAAHIAQAVPGLRSLLLRAYPAGDVQKQAHDFPNLYYLGKPFTVSELSLTVRRVLGEAPSAPPHS